MATLKELRRQSQLSQLQLADAVGVLLSEVRRLENGRPASAGVKAKLLAHFKVESFDDPPMTNEGQSSDDDDLYDCQWPLPIPRL